MVLDLILGIFLLMAGRNMFWLCVGTVGFLVGAESAVYLGLPAAGPMGLLLALGLGLVGIVLAVTFEWLVVVIGVGFLGGGYLLMEIFTSRTSEPFSLLIFIVGGIVGLCLMVIVFDPALILISSLLGASLIVQAFPEWGQQSHYVLFIACTLTGLIMQYMTFKTSIPEHGSVRSVGL